MFFWKPAFVGGYKKGRKKTSREKGARGLGMHEQGGKPLEGLGLYAHSSKGRAGPGLKGFVKSR